MTRLLFALGYACFLIACTDFQQEEVKVPLWTAGTDVSQPVEAVGNVSVSISRAELAFGTLYLCPGAQAGELCDTARLEWLESAVVDTTRQDAVLVGELVGATGPVRSWMYDLGLSSQFGREEPFVLEAARQLGGASLVLEGRATVLGFAIPFRAAVPVQQQQATEQGVPIVRKSTSDVFSRDVTAEESGLVVRFDPRTWVRGIDFRDFVETRTCIAGGPEVVCEGLVEHRCDDDGSMIATQDCQAKNQVCLAKRGCATELVLESGTQAFRSIQNTLVAGQRPAFEWL